MAFSSSTPLPVSVRQVLGHLKGLERYAIAAARLETPDAVEDDAALAAMIEPYIRAAQHTLETESLIPFFETRYCTAELASQLSLTLGAAGQAGYDEIIQPLDYDASQWRMVSGRTEVPRMPIISVTTFRLSLAHGGQIANVPADWLNLDQRHGQIHLMPNALTSLAATFFTIFAIHPMLYRPGMGPTTPLLIHLQYTAGLCKRVQTDGASAYDPAEYPKNTLWPQAEVSDYQTQLSKLAAAGVKAKIAPSIHRGGVSVGVDGLSRSVNPGLVSQEAMQTVADVMAWAQGKKARAVGPGWVFSG